MLLLSNGIQYCSSNPRNKYQYHVIFVLYKPIFVVLPTVKNKKTKNDKTKRFSDVRALTIILSFLIVLFATYEKSFRWIINLERTNPTKTSNFWDIFIELLLVK